jgi:hypothetical protein
MASTLSAMKLKTYVNAYIVRLNRGETMTDIDNLYLSINRLTKDEIDQIHKKLSTTISKTYF